MTRVKAPNGTVMELDESVASGLVGSEGSGWSLVKDEPTPEPKATRKSSTSKK